MAKDFEAKVVWITGGGTGIGEAMAMEFARRKATVVISGRRREKLDEAAEVIAKLGGEVLALPCDVTLVGDIEEAVKTIVEKYGRLDVAVANAGFGVGGKIEDLTAADWKRQLDTNVVGLAMTIKYTLPELKKTGGRIALMGSVAGTVGFPGNGPYCASKFAVRAIGQSLHGELAGTGVSVTTIQPGFVESEIGRVDNQGVYHESWEDQRPQNLIWPADKAAREMVKAIAGRKREAVVTGHGKAIAFLAYHTPGLVQAVIRRSKKAKKIRPSDRAN
ncbi:MAG: SDR family NAD(P)-dependent oxidoreductase [Bradymonadaceae bacterium]